MAAIVASTLRRRTMQQKQSDGRSDDDFSTVKTPSFHRKPPSPVNRKYQRLIIEDFWPECVNEKEEEEEEEEEDVKKLQFASFELVFFCFVF